MAKAVLNACVFSFGNELIEFLIYLKYSSKAHFTWLYYSFKHFKDGIILNI